MLKNLLLWTKDFKRAYCQKEEKAEEFGGCLRLYERYGTRGRRTTQIEKVGTIKVVTLKNDLKFLVIIELDQENPDQERPIISPINKGGISGLMEIMIVGNPFNQQRNGGSNEVNWVLSREEYVHSGLRVGDPVTLILLKSSEERVSK